MCNWSESIEERGMREGIKKGIKEGIKKERITAIERMIKANATREQILLYGYTEEEYVEAENAMCMNA